MKKIIVLIIVYVAIFYTNSNAQQWDIGDENYSTDQQLPIFTSNNYSRTKFLYLNKELGDGIINSIAFKINTVTSDNFDLSRIKLYVKSTTNNYIEDTIWYESMEDYSLVFDGRIKYYNQDGWIYIDFQNEFTKNGTNIEVAVEYVKSYNSDNILSWENDYSDGLISWSNNSDVPLGSELFSNLYRPFTRFVTGLFYSNTCDDLITTMSILDVGETNSVIGDIGKLEGSDWINLISESSLSTNRTFTFEGDNNSSDNSYSGSGIRNLLKLKSSGPDNFQSTRLLRIITSSNGEYAFSEDKRVIVDGSCNFYGSGGLYGSYNNNEVYKVKFIPSSTTAKLIVSFVGAINFADGDTLDIYQGSSATPLVSYYGSITPSLINSLNNGESITFIFRSDENSTSNGWNIHIVAQLPCSGYYGNVGISLLGGTCTDRRMSLSLTGNEGTFSSWEQSIDGTNFSSISGNNPLIIDHIARTTFYRAIVTDQGFQCHSNYSTYSAYCDTYSSTGGEYTAILHCEKDAMISSHYTEVTWNQGNWTLIQALKGTAGTAFNRRCLFEFSLDNIPVGAQIVSATLNLYGSSHYVSSSNASYIQVVTQPWHEYSLNWQTQPTFTETYKKSIACTTSSNQNNTIDIKDIVQSWVNGTLNNYGLLLKLQSESGGYAQMNYASGDYSNQSLMPTLTIHYVPTPSIILNTELLINPANPTEGVKYCIFNTGGEKLCEDMAGNKRYIVSQPSQGSTSIINVSFYSTSINDSIKYNLTIDDKCNIKYVRIGDIDVDTSNYKKNGNKIYFLGNNSSIEELNQLPVYPILKEGLILTPKAATFNLFKVNGIDLSDSYSINIKDIYENILFTTTSKTIFWNGKTTFYNSNTTDTTQYYVQEGTYKYEITIDGVILKGQFLVQY